MKMCTKNVVTFLSLIFLQETKSLNILHFVPGWSSSHLLFNYGLAETLTAEGHNITMWTHLYSSNNFQGVKNPPKNVTELRFRQNVSAETMEGLKVIEDLAFQRKMGFTDWHKFAKSFSTAFLDAFTLQTEEFELLNKLRQTKYDLVLLHFIDLSPIAISHMLGIEKLVWVSPGIYIPDLQASEMALDNTPSYIPSVISTASNKMNFWQRMNTGFINVMNRIFTYVIPINLIGMEVAKFRQPPKTFPSYHNQDFPELSDLSQSVIMLLINGEQFIDFPRPLPYNVMYTGKVGSSKNSKISKPLDEKWTKILQRESKGVIIFSMGTVANTSKMPEEMKEIFLDVFSRFSDYTIVWRIENAPKTTKNHTHIFVVNWIPQHQLLTHNKTKLFITHAGYNSILETTKAAIPVLMMPLFLDQYCNSLRAERHGLGLTLDKEHLSARLVFDKMNILLTDNRYVQNALKFRSMLEDKLVSPGKVLSQRLKKFAKAKWHPSLRQSQQLTLIQFYCLDIIAFVLFLFTLLIHFGYRIATYLMKKQFN